MPHRFYPVGLFSSFLKDDYPLEGSPAATHDVPLLAVLAVVAGLVTADDRVGLAAADAAVSRHVFPTVLHLIKVDRVLHFLFPFY